VKQQSSSDIFKSKDEQQGLIQEKTIANTLAYASGNFDKNFNALL
jgi:hypothetical protein